LKDEDENETQWPKGTVCYLLKDEDENECNQRIVVLLVFMVY
jgi:hypothetical protein